MIPYIVDLPYYTMIPNRWKNQKMFQSTKQSSTRPAFTDLPKATPSNLELEAKLAGKTWDLDLGDLRPKHHDVCMQLISLLDIGSYDIKHH